MEKFIYAKDEMGLSRDEISTALLESIEGRKIKNALIIPPDFTRFHSNAGYITNVYYHALTEMGANVERYKSFKIFWILSLLSSPKISNEKPRLILLTFEINSL